MPPRKAATARPSEADEAMEEFRRKLGPALRPGDRSSVLVNALGEIGPGDCSSDEALAEAWAQVSDKRRYGKTTFAYWRFRKGLDREDAIQALEKALRQREAPEMIKRIREFEVEDWHSAWGDWPLEERRELLRKAGRPDLIQPEVCERFGVE